MVARWPQLADGLTARHATLDTRLEVIDASLRSATAALEGKPILASHPVYQYFARAYGLDIRSLHWEPDIHPDDAAWRESEVILAMYPAQTMLWEGEPTAATRATR
jgi:zinc transport system substrate-binding protein